MQCSEVHLEQANVQKGAPGQAPRAAAQALSPAQDSTHQPVSAMASDASAKIAQICIFTTERVSTQCAVLTSWSRRLSFPRSMSMKISLCSQCKLPALRAKIKENGAHVSRTPPDPSEAFPRMILVQEKAASICKRGVWSHGIKGVPLLRSRLISVLCCECISPCEISPFGMK